MLNPAEVVSVARMVRKSPQSCKGGQISQLSPRSLSARCPRPSRAEETEAVSVCQDRSLQRSRGHLAAGLLPRCASLGPGCPVCQLAVNPSTKLEVIPGRLSNLGSTGQNSMRQEAIPESAAGLLAAGILKSCFSLGG